MSKSSSMWKAVSIVVAGKDWGADRQSISCSLMAMSTFAEISPVLGRPLCTAHVTPRLPWATTVSGHAAEAGGCDVVADHLVVPRPSRECVEALVASVPAVRACAAARRGAGVCAVAVHGDGVRPDGGRAEAGGRLLRG